MKGKKEEKVKFKVKTGRKRDENFCFDVMRHGDASGVYNFLKEKVSLEEISELIYLFLDEMRETILEEKLGVELPCGIGYIQISGIKEKAYKLGAASSKLNKGVVNPNYHTEGHVFISWYRFTNNDSVIKRKVGMFEHAYMYRFTSSIPFRKKISSRIKEGKWTHWAKFLNRQEMYGKSMLFKKDEIKKPIQGISQK